MRKVLLISHGELAKGALNTLHIFTNELDNFTAIAAYTPECDNPQSEIEKFFEEAGDEQVVCFSDISFGSVNQLLMPYLSRENTYVFTGFNLPMLLQFTALPEDSTIDDFRALVDAGSSAVMFMNDFDFSSSSDEDE